MIGLGDTVQDRITGFTGVVTGINTYAFSSNRVVVSSRELREGKPIGEESFDEVQLEKIENETIKYLYTMESKFRFMDEVEDVCCPGFTGKVIGIAYFLNGCVRIGVQSPKLKDNSPIQWEWFPEDQLKLVAKAEEIKPKFSGGPMPECNKTRG